MLPTFLFDLETNAMLTRFAAAALIATAFGVVTLDVQAQKKAKASGSIELTRTDEGKWRYRVKDADGKTIAMPLPQMHWDSKADALKAIGELKSILDTATPTEAKDEPKKTEKKSVEKKSTTP
jgi:uncharacterized protein YegP (UPF0339 family)